MWIASVNSPVAYNEDLLTLIDLLCSRKFEVNEANEWVQEWLKLSDSAKEDHLQHLKNNSKRGTITLHTKIGYIEMMLNRILQF